VDGDSSNTAVTAVIGTIIAVFPWTEVDMYSLCYGSAAVLVYPY